MSAASSKLRPSLPATPADSDTAPATPPHRTRRALLAGLAGGVAALVANAFSRVGPVKAVVANPVILGQSNDEGSATTDITTLSSSPAFRTTNHGTGAALDGEGAQGNGVWGRNHGRQRYGVLAENNAGSTGTGAAIRARGKRNHGIVVDTAENTRTAITATHTGSGTAIAATGNPGVWAESATGNALTAISTATSGAVSGVYAQSTSTTGSALQGYASASTGANRGVFATTNSASGLAILALNPATSTPFSLLGRTAIQGHATDSGSLPTGVIGTATGSSGQNAFGVYGVANSDYGVTVGVYGHNGTTGGTAYAGYFFGDVEVNGTFSKTTGSFKIDHPLDPANKYLYHSFVESPDMMNVYNGNVTTDARGEATVSLPDWFEALNSDFRYQLTPIGSFAQATVKDEIANNRFTIQTDEPHTKVSWQVTGVRHDAYAEAHRIEVEVAKTGKDKGKYLHPLEHGQPVSERLAPGPLPEGTRK